jgi:murein DD-endopeptidase MepM/ murein hydrolase activator NlpD
LFGIYTIFKFYGGVINTLPINKQLVFFIKQLLLIISTKGMVQQKKMVLWAVFLLPIILTAQVFSPKNYPTQYFTWPVKAKIGLAANFGELRPNHYHMGLDCKTDQKENAPIVAAAAGYIAKVKIEPYGFGRCIYINHPNGLTTLYAHLNEFYPALEKYITQQQYQLQTWRLFIDIPPNLFPVAKDQFIAFSGNTGGSQGPHLHFEIRDTKTDKVLNPLLFGFDIQDNIAPDVLRLAVYDRSKSVFEQSPRFIPIKKVNGKYVTVPAKIALPFNKVSFAITAYDRYSGSTNQNGIFESILLVDEKPVIGFQLDSISYDETRYLNAHIDYKLKSSGGPFVQHLSRLPGYPQGVYKEVMGNGVIELNTTDTAAIQIKVKDTEGNTSFIEFNVKALIETPNKTNANQQNLFKPGFFNIYESSTISLYLPETHLYDHINFICSQIMGKAGNVAYQIHNGFVPVQAMFPIKIKNTTTTAPNKMIMHRWWGGKNDYAATTKEGDWYKASFRAFGNVELLQDEIPPTITPIGFKNGMNANKLNRLAFVILDNCEDVVNFKATLNGQWIRFSNDKGKTFVYKFDEHCSAGPNELIISVEDLAGNKTIKTYQFNR